MEKIGSLKARLVLLAVLFWLTTPVSSFAAQQLNIAVASNFLGTAQKLLAEFTATHHIKTDLISGSSGQLTAQILNGAPYDVFLSADTRYPNELIKSNQFDAATVEIYAIGQLMVWSRDHSDWSNLVANPPSRFALANPKLAPYGAAAKRMLENEGVWSEWSAAAITGQNVNQVLQFVRTGSVDVAFIAASQARAISVGAVFHPPENDVTQGLAQAGIILKASGHAAAFMRYLRTDSARQIIRADGYRVPREATSELEGAQ